MRSHVVLFGDSITEQSFKPDGWGSALANTYTRKVDVVVRGFGGYNSRWGYSNPPIAVTIFFGANDAALLRRTSERQHVPVEEYKENLRKIIRHFKGTMLVVIITPPPINEEGRNEYAQSLYGDKARELSERTNEVTGVYAKQCIELAKELGFYSINLWSKMQETEGWQKKFLRVFNEGGLDAIQLASDYPRQSEIDLKNLEKSFQERSCKADL
ncbi:hypothetical protein MKX01_040236 [Papaver californicum]|nr:hypothetical protein MKX01_040236 [Papaver californicum]